MIYDVAVDIELIKFSVGGLLHSPQHALGGRLIRFSFPFHSRAEAEPNNFTGTQNKETKYSDSMAGIESVEMNRCLYFP